MHRHRHRSQRSGTPPPHSAADGDGHRPSSYSSETLSRPPGKPRGTEARTSGLNWSPSGSCTGLSRRDCHVGTPKGSGLAASFGPSHFNSGAGLVRPRCSTVARSRRGPCLPLQYLPCSVSLPAQMSALSLSGRGGGGGLYGRPRRTRLSQLAAQLAAVPSLLPSLRRSLHGPWPCPAVSAGRRPHREGPAFTTSLRV